MLILATWEAVFRWLHVESFPTPLAVAEAFVQLFEPLRAWDSRPLVEGLVVSFIRLFVGFAVSVALGAALGLLMWRFKSVDEFLGPLFLGLQTLPSVCWVPLAVLVLGLNEKGVLFVVAMGSFFSIAISLRDGLRTIPPIYHRAGAMLGASGWKLYRYVLLPASLPALASSLRQGFSFAWRSLMGAELMFAARWHGLGAVLGLAKELGDTAWVLAVMAIMVLIGILADRFGFAVLEERIYKRFGLSTRE